MFKKIKQRVAESGGLPKDILLGLPLITMAGGAEMTVENFKGIIEYSDDIIRINTGAGLLRIEGKKLLLKQVTNEIINISGIIKRLEYL